MHQLEGERWHELSLESVREIIGMIMFFIESVIEIIGMDIECKSHVTRVIHDSSHNISISWHSF